MKHRIFVAVACVVLAAVILLLLPSAHPQVSTPTKPHHTAPSGTKPTNPQTDPPEASGTVRLYSCNEAWAAALEVLAAQYTDLTGVPVLVLRPETDDCQASLELLLESEDPPTVLCVHSQSQLQDRKDDLLNLKNTAFASSLYAASYGLYLEGRLVAVPMDLEGFGLLLNAEVLGAKGALSRNDITDRQTLAMAAQILKDNSVKAFPAADFDTLTAVCLMLRSDASQLREFLDLYMSNCHTSGDARDQFRDGQCAFYLGGTWSYPRLFSDEEQALQVRNLDILPAFTAGGMQYLFSTAWCVNGSARQADVDATLAFLAWLVSPGEDGTVPVDALQTLTPFASSGWYGNQLEKKLLSYMNAEPAVVRWTPASGDYTKLLVAMQTYMESRTDENWNLLQVILAQIAGNA